MKLNHNESNKAEADTSLPILEYEVEQAIKSLKDGKTGPDNIPSELIKHGGENLQKLLTSLCQMIWNTKEWPIQWTRSLVIPIPKGDSRKCSNYRNISFINHASNILLKILLNRLNQQAEKIISEEQAGFRKGRSTVEQITNCRIIMKKNIEIQKIYFIIS